MTIAKEGTREIRRLEVLLDRDLFMRRLLRHVAGTLEEVIGLREVSGVLGVVGQRLGEEIDRSYRDALQVARLARPQVAEVLVDLERREDRRRRPGVPFPGRGHGESSVFGTMAAQNLRYARVVVEQAIATGGCGRRIVVHLEPSAEVLPADGREFFGAT